MNIRFLTTGDIPIIVSSFSSIGWDKPAAVFEKYLEEQNQNLRQVWVVFENSEFIGYVTLKWIPEYPFFAKQGIPEISDLNVLPKYRNQGIGSKLLDLSEEAAYKKSKAVGIGVGLYADYGAAQKIYIKRGYIPDGNGITYNCRTVIPGGTVQVDDDLVLWFVKSIPIQRNCDYSKIQLTPAFIEHYLTIQNMARFYVYDMSEYLGNEEGWEIPKDGLYECIDFKKYWEVKDAFPFLIHYENELAGFVIIDKKGSEPKIDFNMAQFFILRKFKNKGIGRYVAQQCFAKFPGKWEVMVIPGNDGAYNFWKATIANYTEHNFNEYTRAIAHFENTVKQIFYFESK